MNKDDPAFERMLKNEHFMSVMTSCWGIYDAKGTDYTRGKGDLDRLDNFKEASKDAGVSESKVLYIYIYKHWAAFKRFILEGKVESEPIESRILDIINYLVLFLLQLKPVTIECNNKKGDQ
jgi:hypothetical protein